jgi:hypothetical protein
MMSLAQLIGAPIIVADNRVGFLGDDEYRADIAEVGPRAPAAAITVPFETDTDSPIEPRKNR